MNLMRAIAVPTSEAAPTDASKGAQDGLVSDFLTVQSFSNFAVMTAAISLAWQGLKTLTPAASGLWVPYAFALVWGVISVVLSIEGFRKKQSKKLRWGSFLMSVFLAAVNTFVLGAAVVGAQVVTAGNP